MAAPLLARSMSELLFAAISAIAFTTVLGTVSGLILAAAGAVTHDLIGNAAAGSNSPTTSGCGSPRSLRVVVGVIAIVLGILFKELNVSYLVGWAFSVAASANLPALVMLLFWKGTTRQGIIAAILVGMVSFARLDSGQRRHLRRRLRLAQRNLARAVQPTGNCHHPAGVCDTGGGVAADGRKK